MTIKENIHIANMEKNLLARESGVTQGLIDGYQEILQTAALTYGRGAGSGDYETTTSQAINVSFLSRALIAPALLTDAVLDAYVEIAANARLDNLRTQTQQSLRRIADIDVEQAGRVFSAVTKYDTAKHTEMLQKPSRYAGFLDLERYVAEKVSHDNDSMSALYNRFSGYVLTSKAGVRRETLKTYAFAAAVTGHAFEACTALSTLNKFEPEVAIVEAMGVLAQKTDNVTLMGDLMTQFQAAAAQSGKEMKQTALAQVIKVAETSADKEINGAPVSTVAVTMLAPFVLDKSKDVRILAAKGIEEIIGRLPAQNFQESAIEKAITQLEPKDRFMDAFSETTQANLAHRLQNLVNKRTHQYRQSL